MKRLPYAVAVAAALAIAGAASAEEAPSTRLVESARRAGMEASPLVFERDAEADTETGAGGGISGKTLLLATAIASAAVVTAAWLLRGRCEPAETIVVELRQARPAFLPDGTAVAALPLPSYPLPVLCQPRR